ncbi:phospholipase B [Rhodocollybia butyracea]|uniref:Lysophospholipase n=1 Tax=Rhodocollybia butyracea TaxID=206335 RepID=A0A9P5PZ26_9AGAR|nr:phospholipase B [Rhodocollybia butyracea]
MRTLLGLLAISATAIAFEDSVTDYAPSVNIACPNLETTAFVREWNATNQTLNPAEEEYVNTRINTTIAQAWNDWLGNGSQLGYNITAFQGNFPKIGLALPGGGLRAAQVGAAALSGIDARNDSAKTAGTGGLLQVSSYLSGLSGGSWVTGSLYFNNFPTLNDLVFGNGNNLTGWLLDLAFASPDGDDVFSEYNQYFYGSILWSVMSKANTGIDTSITDPWARMISYHFLNQTSRSNFFTNDTAHGAGQLWSNIPTIPAWQQRLTPFPILVTDSRPQGDNATTALGLTPTVYEITPFEFASYDPGLSAGVNLTFAGTPMTNSKPVNASACVTGFDQAGFMMGTSASLFNQILDFAHNTLQDFSSSDSNALLYVLSRQLTEVRTRADDVANWYSPFNGLKPSTYEDSNSTWLSLLDGASNGENIPLAPLFVKERALDVIVPLDSSADDTNNWPNGTGLLISAQRQQQLLQASHQAFPPLPQDAQAFIDTGARERPTFFGCDPTQNPPEFPLIIYIPNTPPFNGDAPAANTGTFQLQYTAKASQVLFDQVHNNTISGFVPNTTHADPNFGRCLQCAAVDRARYKLSPIVNRSEFCQTCFTQYCFNPEAPPSLSEVPDRQQLFVDPDPQGLVDFLSANKFKLIGGLVGLIVFIALLVGGLIWWKKRRDKQFFTQYHQVSALHEEEEATMKRYTQYLRPEAYEMPSHRGSLYSDHGSSTAF